MTTLERESQERELSEAENPSETPKSLEKHRFRLAGCLAAVVVPLALCVLAGVAFSVLASQTNVVPDLVDFVRNLPFVGPDRMAVLENAVYDAQDQLNQFVYDQTHNPIVISSSVAEELAGPTPAKADPPIEPTPAGGSSHITLTLIPLKPVTPTPTGTPGPRPPAYIPPLIVSDVQPGEGTWVAEGLPLSYQANPPMRRTFYRPDPQRPYSRVDLVWIDTEQTSLTLVPGISEPRPVDGVRGTGVIPPAVQNGGKLLAAWNGGFLTIHGAYGMMVDRRVVAPPRDGFATLAQYRDGALKIGVWGQDITLTPDLVSFRENGPILVDKGEVNKDANLSWGRSVAGETRIWRSGIGLTADGALLYAAGNSLDAQTLGEAMRLAGAVEAMQLDVNSWHVYFYTYQFTVEGLIPTKLDASIPGPLRLYLTPYDRDFMYLTLK